jgi:hypothetical protein
MEDRSPSRRNERPGKRRGGLPRIDRDLSKESNAGLNETEVDTFEVATESEANPEATDAAVERQELCNEKLITVLLLAASTLSPDWVPSNIIFSFLFIIYVDGILSPVRAEF